MLDGSKEKWGREVRVVISFFPSSWGFLPTFEGKKGPEPAIKNLTELSSAGKK